MTGSTVHRRHVFYLSGFDPKGAAYYHRLYAEGAASQGATLGQACRVGPRERGSEPFAQHWKVTWQTGQGAPADRVDTTFEYLGWDDLVRAHWPRGVVGVAIGSLQGYWAALSSGTALARVWRQSRRTLLALAYPAVFWLMALAIAALVGLGAMAAARALLPTASWPAPLGTLMAPLLGLACAALIGWAALAIERRLHTSWLLRIYHFADLWARGRLPDLERRLDAMADRVLQSLHRGDADEVLLVGYSVGSMLSASVMARVLRQWPGAPGQAGAGPGPLAMLTLGQCVPLLGLMRHAHAFRQELAVLAHTRDLRWTDYSSPGDWGSFALVDPLRICQVSAPQAHLAAPRMLSPRFHTLFDPSAYALLRRDKRRLHLQYLMAVPKPGGYDFFRLTAGPDALPSPMPPPPGARNLP